MELNPFSYAFHEDPYPTYRWLRDHAPLYRNDALDFWALSRWSDVLAASLATYVAVELVGQSGVAYATGIVSTKFGITPWAGVLAGMALAALAAVAVGIPTLRLKGHYFAIFTLAVGLIIHLVIQKWESLTHGHVGVIGIPGPGPLGPIGFDSTAARSYLALFFLALTVAAVSRLVRSPIGRTLMAVRESDQRPSKVIGTKVAK